MGFGLKDLADVGGGVLDFVGGIYENSSNARSAADARIANELASERMMAWQERMSNTAHQREVKDLRAAGMNPILTATGGSGASAQGGSALSNTPGNPMRNPIGPAVHTALAASMQQSQKENVEAGTEKTNQETTGLALDNQGRAIDNMVKILYGLQTGFMKYEQEGQKTQVGAFEKDAAIKKMHGSWTATEIAQAKEMLRETTATARAATTKANLDAAAYEYDLANRQLKPVATAVEGATRIAGEVAKRRAPFVGRKTPFKSNQINKYLKKGE
ncbi:MAG: DNA pilot protein [Microviridae sp.]|nr:MAG: DNA pilot protein [Microviridae sp.]